MRFSITSRGIDRSNYPLKIILWADGSDILSEVHIERSHTPVHASVSEPSTSRKLHVQCISTSRSKIGIALLTWHGISEISLDTLRKKLSPELILRSVAEPFPSNGELTFDNISVGLEHNRSARSPLVHISHVRNKSLIHKNVEFLKNFKAIDPEYPHMKNSVNSEFYDIFFHKLNNLEIPVSHILLNTTKYVNVVPMLKRMIFITNSRLSTDFEKISGDHAREGDYLSYMLLYMVNYTTYCEDWNLFGTQKRMTERIRPNIQITSSGDCEDTAFYLHFFYEMLLTIDSDDTNILKLKNIARRYVPFVQLGAVGSHRMVEYGPKTSSNFEAHSYFQLMPVEFVIENMNGKLALDKKYDFDHSEFKPRLSHMIIEGTNLCITSPSVRFEVPQNITSALQMPRTLVGKYKTMSFYPQNFYNYMLIGISGMFDTTEGYGKPLQFIFKRKDSEKNYGTMYSDSITLQNNIYEIYPAEFYTNEELEHSKNVLRNEMPIYIDGRADYVVAKEWHKKWVDAFEEKGVKNSITDFKACSSEALFSVYESMDMDICTQMCLILKSKGINNVCMAYECIGKGLWGISLGIP